MTEFKIIAKTFQGLEEVLAKELINLGANNVEIGRRMVACTGDQAMLYRANFCTRTAVKILKPIREFKATDADEVYEVVKTIDWESYMDQNNTFLVDAVIFSENFRHSKFVAYRVKDAIADYWREKTGDRPNVGISNPDIRVNVHIAENEVTISLDSSGESLHQRGYKTANVPAPINEVLAAGLIMLSGWDGECDLIDPFCGSGTILIEAACIALNVYPGVFRKEYAFEKWKDFNPELFDSIYNDDSQEREFNHKIYGYDINRQVVQIALGNVQSAGVKDVVSVEQRDFYEFEKPLDRAVMITNPPYGDRITTDDIFDLYATIGRNLKRNFAGNDAWIISHHEELFEKIGFRPSTKYALFNGALECEFRKYQVFDGSLRERREEGMDIKSDEERRHNLHYKPHRKNEDGEWGGERRTEDESHYFKSKPFKDKPSWGKPNERRSQSRDTDDDGRSGRPLNPRFTPADDEEAEIINRHLGKWGDRVYRPERPERPGSFGSRNQRDDDRRSFKGRDQRDDDRRSFGNRDRRDDGRRGFGNRDQRDDDRRGFGSRDRRDGDRRGFGSRDRRDDGRRDSRFESRESRKEGRREYFSGGGSDSFKKPRAEKSFAHRGGTFEQRTDRAGGQRKESRPFPRKKDDN